MRLNSNVHHPSVSIFHSAQSCAGGGTGSAFSIQSDGKILFALPSTVLGLLTPKIFNRLAIISAR